VYKRQVPGIPNAKGKVDLDYFYGKDEDFEKYRLD